MKKDRRRLWLLSATVGLLGLTVGVMTSGPVFVDSFHAQHPPTRFDVLVPNLIVTLPYALGPALLVPLVGFGIKKIRSSNQGTPETLKP